MKTGSTDKLKLLKTVVKNLTTDQISCIKGGLESIGMPPRKVTTKGN